MRLRPTFTALLASLAPLAAGAAPARAAPLPVPATPAVYAAARAVAVAHWGVDPCGGSVTVQWASLDPRVNAIATWSNPVSLYGNAAANHACSITYNLHQPWTWARFCTITEHELGHLAGQRHADDPGNVMSPYYTEPSAECLAAPAPAAASAALRAAGRTSSRARRAKARAARHRHRAASHRRST